ncbi:MAG: beta-propeller fold lactonase family protein, partial [Chloroflexi bacterium]|nr:beta-propeller fold lactonase family protein [Chloroflexota bacterium]
MTVSPDGNHVYATGSAEDEIAAFSRDSGTGALTFVAIVKQGEGGVDGLLGPLVVVVSPDGKNVYATGNAAGGALVVFSRNSTTGVLTFVEVQKDGEA